MNSICYNDWIIEQSSYNKKENSFYETLFMLSNGYVGLRSTIEFGSESSIPGVFFANVYDYGISVNNQIVNAPNWLDFRLYICGGQINFDFIKILDFSRNLNMREASVETSIRFKDSAGRITRFFRRDIVHGTEDDLALNYIEVTPENYSGVLRIESCLNYSQGNNYHGGFLGNAVKSKHLDILKSDIKDNEIQLDVQTKKTKIKMCYRTKFIASQDAVCYPIYEKDRCGVSNEINMDTGNSYSFTNYVCFKSSCQCDNPEFLAEKKCSEVVKLGIDYLINLHTAEWNKRWNLVGFDLDGDRVALMGMRYGLFQLLQAPYLKIKGTNIPARGLSSEYHNGHFFFNTELYKVPFYSWIMPNVAESLLWYRVRTLNNAKQSAISLGCEGIRWSEESDIDGMPAGPDQVNNFIEGMVSNERTGQYVQHISADVAWSIFTYVNITGDYEFLEQHGTELIIEAARFYSSLVQRSSTSKIYSIDNVIGPDEYHVKVNNNFYTNAMAKWTLEYAIKLCNVYCQCKSHYNVDDNEISKWKDIIQYMKEPNINSDGVIEQFDSYFALQDRKVEKYDSNSRPVIDTDIQEKAFCFENMQSQIIKQCDVIMSMSMFRNKFSIAERKSNMSYYDVRTVHESSLSATHAGIVAADSLNIEEAYKYFLMSCRFNLDFQPRENYNNGIHLASYAGAWLILLYGFVGIQEDTEILSLKPQLPPQWDSLEFNLCWRGHKLNIKFVDSSIVIMNISENASRYMKLKLYDIVYELKPMQKIRLNIKDIDLN